MFVIQFPQTVGVQQLEGFPAKKPPNPKDKKNPKGIERSFDGALHIFPGATKEITKDEKEYIGKMGIPFVVLMELKHKKIIEPVKSGNLNNAENKKKYDNINTAKDNKPLNEGVEGKISLDKKDKDKKK